LAVSRSFGDFELTDVSCKRKLVSAEPYVYSLINDGSFCIIMGSDGLWDMISKKDAEFFLNSQLLNRNSLQTICDNFIKRIQHMDNVTIIIIGFNLENRID